MFDCIPMCHGNIKITNMWTPGRSSKFYNSDVYSTCTFQAGSWLTTGHSGRKGAIIFVSATVEYQITNTTIKKSTLPHSLGARCHASHVALLYSHVSLLMSPLQEVKTRMWHRLWITFSHQTVSFIQIVFSFDSKHCYYLDVPIHLHCSIIMMMPVSR